MTMDTTLLRISGLHPQTTGPDYRDEEGDPATIVRCPDCGQLEWWTGKELQDHGRCRAVYAACVCNE